MLAPAHRLPTQLTLPPFTWVTYCTQIHAQAKEEPAAATAQHTQEAAPAAAAEPEGTPADAAAAVQHTAEGASAGLAAGGQQAKDEAAVAAGQAKTAAAAAREGLAGAGQQMNGGTEAAADKAHGWIDEVQVRATGLQGKRGCSMRVGLHMRHSRRPGIKACEHCCSANAGAVLLRMRVLLAWRMRWA